MDFLDSNKILTPNQHGFRQGRSRETQLITTLNDFSKTLNNTGQTDAVLLDFSKAFDKVDHKILLSKLDCMGIQGPLHDWVSSFLQGRSQYVFVDGASSYPVRSFRVHLRVLSSALFSFLSISTTFRITSLLELFFAFLPMTVFFIE